MKIEIITTSDGSHTLYLPHLNETYHSTHGALRESQHIFIEHGLRKVMEGGSSPIRILEVGFGTGLNAWLTAQVEWPVEYTSLELYPLEETVWSKLNYSDHSEKELFETLHRAEWNKEVQITENFRMRKISEGLENVDLSGFLFDLVYFDAFAPSKQPEMWTEENFRKIKNQLAPGGILVSYCASGAFKRTLKVLGFEVEALAGPPGKKEMTRASLKGSDANGTRSQR